MKPYLTLALTLPLVAFSQTFPRKVPARLHQYLTSTVRLSTRSIRTS
jgi:hypothetical protein